jgi:glycosyltransferase A (GT-A) superfamily protein (DUF2064 family)
VKTQFVVIAKEPVAGKAKTRLCPPCTPDQAATLARAALADTIATISATPTARRVLLLDGLAPRPPGWTIIAQRGEGLGQRLAHGFSDSALADAATVLVGMDTPQLMPGLLCEMVAALAGADAIIGLAEDGGWWMLGLRDPTVAAVLALVPMSQPDTGELTLKALAELGLSIAYGPTLRDVDTFADLAHVAALCPSGGFAATVNALELA